MPAKEVIMDPVVCPINVCCDILHVIPMLHYVQTVQITQEKLTKILLYEDVNSETTLRKGRQLELSCLATCRLHTQAGSMTVSSVGRMQF